MKRSKFSEEQILAILREQEAGAKTADVCRRHGVSSATFYAWKAKYGGMDVSEARRLKALEAENAKLKRLLGRRHARQHGAEGPARPKVVTPAARRQAVAHLAEIHEMSERRACRVIGADRSSIRFAAVFPTTRWCGGECASWRPSGAASAIAACMSCCARRGW
jgi:putative transposase